jgi:hypothetical protein
MRSLEQYWVWKCDECGRETRANARTMTDRDKPPGWHTDIVQGIWLDLCPLCNLSQNEGGQSKVT